MNAKTGGFKEHGVMMYLDKDLHRAFIRLQADKDLGRSYAALLAVTEGFYKLGLLSEEVYKEHVKKYGQPLGGPPVGQSIPEENSTEIQLQGMLEQWDIHTDLTWRLKAVAYAKKFPTLEPAKKLIAKESECNEVIRQAKETS